VARVDRFGDLAFDLEPGQEGLEEGATRRVEALAHGERRCEHRDGGMGQQPEDAVGRRRQLRVVVVHRVAACGVGERSLRGRRGHLLRAEDRRLRLAAAGTGDVLAHDGASTHGRAGEHDAEAVDQAAFGLDDRLLRDAFE
jgi:hypothetical protein